MRNFPYKSLTLLIPATLLVAALIFAPRHPVLAIQSEQETQATQDPLTIDNEVCLSCHEVPGQSMQLENGELLDLTVWRNEFSTSIHGELGYACVQCHRKVGNYPHPPSTAASWREFTISMNETCTICHTPQAQLSQDSVHADALAEGQRQAAVCTDCHGAHNIQRWKDPTSGSLTQLARERIPEACANCHYGIYLKYIDNVHGTSLYDENNTDVPTCIDCHGVHNIQDPTTDAFRVGSPRICAKCHTDETMMEKYDLSTEVLNTYVDDFHGTTVVVFEKRSPDAETNKPVCYDCHGVHDIRRIDDPKLGLQMQENILARCQVCHPEASDSFPAAWLSHYIPSPENNALVYYVNLFYKFFIPGVLGPMILLVSMDAGHSLYHKYLKKALKPKPKTDTQEETAIQEEVLDVVPSNNEQHSDPPSSSPNIDEATPAPKEIQTEIQDNLMVNPNDVPGEETADE